MNDTGVRATYLGALAVSREVIATDAIGKRWRDASALAKWSIGGLAGHLARTAHTVEEYLDGGPAAPDAALRGPAEYYLAVLTPNDLDSDVHVAIRNRGDRAAAAGRDALIDSLDGCIARLHDRLAAELRDRTLTVFGGNAMTLDDYLSTRIVEIVIHVDDLCVSIGRTTPAVPGIGDAIATLVATSGLRHGDLAVLRGLARRERDPAQVLRVL